MVEDLYFNMALIPESDDLKALCIELARANCAERADSYLLGEDALPHVTLCQFNASSDGVKEIWRAFSELQPAPVPLAFRHIYLQYGKGDLEGKCWVGLAVKYEPELIALQKAVFEKLAALGLQGRNTPANFFPHLTFARCDGSIPVVISAAPKADFWGASFPFRLTIGRSDEHGRYHETLYP